MNTKPTSQVIREIGARLRATADNMDEIANAMDNAKDLTYASEAVNAITNLLFSCRLDLLVTRPIRAYQKKLSGMED